MKDAGATFTWVRLDTPVSDQTLFLLLDDLIQRWANIKSASG